MNEFKQELIVDDIEIVKVMKIKPTTWANCDGTLKLIVIKLIGTTEPVLWPWLL